MPSYASENWTIYSNYSNAASDVLFANSSNITSALNNYNIAKQNYIDFLNQQKINGTLSRSDEFYLSKNL